MTFLGVEPSICRDICGNWLNVEDQHSGERGGVLILYKPFDFSIMKKNRYIFH